MANENKKFLGLLTIEFYQHKNNYNVAVYKKKMAEEAGELPYISVYKKEMTEHLHKMQAVVGVMQALKYDLNLVDAEIDVLAEIDQEAYNDLLKSAE